MKSKYEVFESFAAQGWEARVVCPKRFFLRLLCRRGAADGDGAAGTAEQRARPV